jgi:tetratricopeptide (TPR) repeat protein
MRRRPGIRDFRRFVRVHERTLVAGSLIGLALFGGFLSIGVMVDKIRIPVFYRVEGIVGYWDDRWTRRVEYGERLVTAKEYAQAVEFLVALDRDFPARVIEHKRGLERQRILRALGLSYSEMGKKQLALDTYRRLVDFDRRDFESRYLLAQACLKFGEPKMAEEHLTGVLKIHPTHMPSVRAYLKYHFDKSDFAAVIAAYETYLNAFLMRQISVALGQSSTNVYVPVDGRFHDLELRLTLLPEESGELALRGEEFAIEIKQVTMQAPLLVGEPGVSTTPVWPKELSWQIQEMAPVGIGRYRALGPGAALRLNIPAQPRGVAEIHLRLRLFKPLDPDLWALVEKSYKNLLRYNDLESARERSLIGIANGAGL